MSSTALLWFAASALVTSLLVRVRDLRPGADPHRRAVTGLLLVFALMVLSTTPGVDSQLESWVGVAHADLLISRLLIVTGVFITLRRFGETLWKGPIAPLSVDVFVYAVVVVTLVASFWAADLPPGGSPLTDHGPQPSLFAFVVTYTLYMSWCFVGMAWNWVRSARGADSAVGVSLEFMACAACAGLAYAAAKVSEQVLLMVSADVEAVETAHLLGTLTGSGAALCMAVGAAWTPMLVFRRWVIGQVRVRRQLVQLRPLWVLLTEQVPQVVLHDPGPRVMDVVAFNARWRLYRRVIEILDARARLEETVDGGNESVVETWLSLRQAEQGRAQPAYVTGENVDDIGEELIVTGRRLLAHPDVSGRTRTH